MPNTQYTKSPRVMARSGKGQPKIPTLKQLRAAIRHIAGVFNDCGRVIRPQYRSANVHGAVRDLVIQRAYPIQGFGHERDHDSLFAKAFDRLVEDGFVVIEGDCAIMDENFAREQKELSDGLREKAKKKQSAPKTKHRDDGRRGVNQRKKYNRRHQLMAD